MPLFSVEAAYVSKIIACLMLGYFVGYMHMPLGGIIARYMMFVGRKGIWSMVVVFFNIAFLGCILQQLHLDPTLWL